MKVKFNDLYRQHSSIAQELEEIFEDVIKNSKFINSDSVLAFESRFKELNKSKYCISCANGTDAIYASLKALKIKQGDEVITTSHTWISTSEAVTQANGKVVFCDTNENDFLINVDKIEELITEKTVGIIPVHLFGQACDMDRIMYIANKYKLWVIEDCAQAHFAKYKNKYVGGFGDCATFSFYPGKNLGAIGDAGAIITNNEDIANWVRLFCRHGGKGNHVIEGINSRLDGIQAGVLMAKSNHILQWTKKRQEAAVFYNQLLKDIDELSLPIVNKGNEHVYHLYVVKTQHRDKLKEYLKENGVDTVINYNKSLPEYKAYNNYPISKNQYAEAQINSRKILSLPIFPEIKVEEQEYISTIIHDFYTKRIFK